MSASPQVAVIGFTRFHPDRLVDLLPHVRSLLEASQKEPGCIGYWAGVDVFDPGVLRISELWVDAEALQRHVKAPHIVPWHAARDGCGMLESRYQVIDIAHLRTV